MRLLVERGAAQPPDLAGGFQPGIALGPDGGTATGEVVVKREPLRWDDAP